MRNLEKFANFAGEGDVSVVAGMYVQFYASPMFPEYYIVLASWLQSLGMPDSMIRLSVTVTLWLGVFVIAGAVYWLFAFPITRAVHYLTRKTPTKWDDYIISDRVIRGFSFMVIAFMIMKLLPAASLYMSISWASVLVKTLKSLFVVSVLIFVLRLTDTIYKASERHGMEIHLLIVLRNFVKIVAAVVAAIVILSIVLNRNVAYILSGLGAMAAILSLVFKDTILDLVAGVKLSIDKSLVKGDWVEVPKLGVSGTVIDVAISAVKVRGWDNSVTSVPPYALFSGGFHNYEYMKRSGGRRIKRSFNIDVNSVRYLSVEELRRFAGQEWTDGLDLGKEQVNLSLFRRYLERRLIESSGFRDDMINMVRELQPGSEGIPVEIYLFTSNTDWKDYEHTQADILDEIIASVHLFSLRMYQHPSGADLQCVLSGHCSDLTPDN